MSPEVVKFQKLPPQDLPVDSQPPRTFAEMVKGAKGDLPSTYHEPTSLQPFATGSTEEPPKVPENTDEPMDEKVEVPKNDDLFFASTKTTRQQQMMAKNDLPEKVDEEEVPTPSKAKGNKRKPKAKAKASAKAKAKASAKAKAKASAKAKAKASAKAKAKASAKAKAKASAKKGEETPEAASSDPAPKAKAKAKSRAAKRKTPSGADQAEAQDQVPASQPAPPRLDEVPAEGPAEDAEEPSWEPSKKTFAGRVRPVRALPAARFDAIRLTFNKNLREHLQYPTSFEVRWSQSI